MRNKGKMKTNEQECQSQGGGVLISPVCLQCRILLHERWLKPCVALMPLKTFLLCPVSGSLLCILLFPLRLLSCLVDDFSSFLVGYLGT